MYFIISEFFKLIYFYYNFDQLKCIKFKKVEYVTAEMRRDIASPMY